MRPRNPFESQIGSLADIAEDIINLGLWLVYIGGPIWFTITVVKYFQSDDDLERKKHKKMMGFIVFGIIAAIYARWFIYDYLWPKFYTG